MSRIVGLDYGERRLGVAVSDPLGTIALPLRTLTVENEADAVRQVAEVCREREADTLVVGLPVSLDGTENVMAEKVRAFVARLEDALNVPIELWDERLSTSFAERVLLEADMSRKKRKGRRDRIAAQVILQGYLDSRSDGGHA